MIFCFLFLFTYLQKDPASQGYECGTSHSPNSRLAGACANRRVRSFCWPGSAPCQSMGERRVRIRGSYMILSLLWFRVRGLIPRVNPGSAPCERIKR